MFRAPEPLPPERSVADMMRKVVSAAEAVLIKNYPALPSHRAQR